MKFNLKRQIVGEEIVKVVYRMWRHEELDSYQLTKKNRAELAIVLSEIEQWTLPKNILRKKLKGNLGFGIFLHPGAKPMSKGELIAPYSGEVSIVPQNQTDDACYAFDPVVGLQLTREEQKKFDPKNRYSPTRFYALKLDASKKGNFTRFINHSSKPNVVAYLVSTRAHPYEIIYFAKKTIRPGEQLLVSYEDEEESYWGTLGVEPFPMTPQTFKVNASLKVVGKHPSIPKPILESTSV